MDRSDAFFRDLSRRRFLAASGGLAAAMLGAPLLGRSFTADAAAVDAPMVDRARMERELRQLVTSRALVLDDPWVLMHAVLALGPDAKHGKDVALDWVVDRFAERVSRGAGTWAGFALDVEAHPNHFLEIMVAVDVPPTRTFATEHAGAVTRDDFLAGAKALFTPAIQASELSWTITVFTAAMPPTADRFANADGRAFTVASIVEAAAQATEAGYADTLAAMRGTKPYGRNALQGFACNGTHVLYGLLDALRHGYDGRGLRERVRLLTQASIYRLGAEVALIDSVLGASQAPLAALNVDAAKLQFLGHSLENLAFARKHGLYTPSADEQKAIDAAAVQLATVVHRLATATDLDALARQVPRAYAVLLGDACHALHALETGAA